MTGPSANALRAARLSRIPGVTIAAAAARFGVSAAEVRRARTDATATALTLSDLAVAALTRDGTIHSGELDDLEGIAAWLDYINHDGATAAEARGLLDEAATRGVLTIDGARWRLVGDWP